MKYPVRKLFTSLLAVALVMLLPMGALAATTLTGTQAADSGGLVTVSGSVTDAGTGQRVSILIVEDGTNINSLTAAQIVYMAQTTPDGNGDYEVSFTMPVAKRTGTYDVYVGATNVGTPDETDLTYATEAPSTAPTTPPAIDMATAKPAVNGSNAFYYVVSITLNDGEATAFTAKHHPSDVPEDDASSNTISLQGIAGTTIKLITVLKDIPDGQEERYITSKVILTYTIGGNSGVVEDSKETTLNQTRSNN